MTWVRGRVGDVPDRLQYELLDRLFEGHPRLEAAHDVQPVHVVQATKGAHQTARPFIRPHARDFLLYWALVDALQPVIEEALGDWAEICGNRWTSLSEDMTPSRETTWTTFVERVEALAAERATRFVVRGDVSSFYMVVDRERLSRTLLEVGADADLVEDLRFLLASWETQGVRGLPQGLPPSGPLANIYLHFADDLLRRWKVRFVRYSDDFALFFGNFAAARARLDGLERGLYERGMTLGGDKTRITRASTAAEQLRPASELLQRAMHEFATDYEWDEEEISEAERDIARDAFSKALGALAMDRYPRSEFIWALRRLGRFQDEYPLHDLPDVLTRMPGLTSAAMGYVAKLGTSSRSEAMPVLEAILSGGFHRDQEWLHILRALTLWDGPCSSATVDRLAKVAEGHPHPVVRARALIAWARQSDPDSTAVAESYFERERRMWQGYPIMAVRDKAARDALYDRWRGDGRTVAQLIDSLVRQPISWRRT
jgi:hypothetical protein